MTSDLVQLADLLGRIGGAMALSIAVYLEMMRQRQCPAKIVIAYILLGMGLLLISNSLGDIVGPPVQHLLTIMGFLTIISLEIISLWWIVKRMDIYDVDFIPFEDIDYPK